MVLLCGHRKRVGKDLFCQILQELLPEKQIVRIAFADALKDEVYEMVLKPFDLPKSILDDDDTKSIMRPLMQWWGTEFRRSTHNKLKGDPLVWVNKLINKIEKLLQEDPNCIPVVCDARFPNEHIETKKHFDALSIRIDRNLNNSDLHISETIMDDYSYLYDYVIDNNDTIEDYKVKIECFIKNVLNKQIQE